MLRGARWSWRVRKSSIWSSRPMKAARRRLVPDAPGQGRVGSQSGVTPAERHGEALEGGVGPDRAGLVAEHPGGRTEGLHAHEGKLGVVRHAQLGDRNHQLLPERRARGRRAPERPANGRRAGRCRHPPPPPPRRPSTRLRRGRPSGGTPHRRRPRSPHGPRRRARRWWCRGRCRRPGARRRRRRSEAGIGGHRPPPLRGATRPPRTRSPGRDRGDGPRPMSSPWPARRRSSP